MSTATTSRIDLYQYEVGTIFQYGASKDWCRDGKAEIIEAFDRRHLVDTYWRDIEHTLSADEEQSAVVIFVPSEHREVSRGDAEVYGDEKVVTITRQHGSYTRRYVRADESPLTDLDYSEYLLRAEKERREEALRQVAASDRSIAHYEARIARLRGEQ